MLQFNQNVLRCYLWVHLAIIATVYAAAYKPARRDKESSGSKA